MAKSLPQAGNVNMRGKKTKLMRCKCCTCIDLRDKILYSIHKKEMKDQEQVTAITFSERLSFANFAELWIDRLLRLKDRTLGFTAQKHRFDSCSSFALRENIHPRRWDGTETSNLVPEGSIPSGGTNTPLQLSGRAMVFETIGREFESLQGHQILVAVV